MDEPKDEGAEYWKKWEASREYAAIQLCRKLSAAGIDVFLQWARITPYEDELVEQLKLGFEEHWRLLGFRVRETEAEEEAYWERFRARHEAETEVIGDYGKRGGWDWRWVSATCGSDERIALVSELAEKLPAAFHPFWSGTRDADAVMRFDKEKDREWVERFRRLDWHDANQAAQKRGNSLAYLSLDQRFNFGGISFEAGRYGDCDMSVTLLDEKGGIAGGTSIFNLPEAEVKPYKPGAEKIPGGAHQRKVLLRKMFG
ncbi:MAG: hypothetical protein JST54_11730 [Deltaproteobacteria bacterium]|nr:hypothetical protein [Deltaproteobacteria bacterium]